MVAGGKSHSNGHLQSVYPHAVGGVGLNDPRLLWGDLNLVNFLTWGRSNDWLLCECDLKKATVYN